MKVLMWLAATILMAQTSGIVKVDSPQARARVISGLPHQRSSIAADKLNRIVVFLNAGDISFTSAPGTMERMACKAGEVRWIAAGDVRAMENTGDQPLQMVEVELENTPRPFTPSDLDPLKTAAKYYSLEFENEQVRVLRIRMGPHEKGARHDHQLNHIVVYLTDHAKGLAGTVKIEGPDIHSEENPLDHPVERIAIDLK
jgi:hypothetical protein